MQIGTHESLMHSSSGAQLSQGLIGSVVVESSPISNPFISEGFMTSTSSVYAIESFDGSDASARGSWSMDVLVSTTLSDVTLLTSLQEEKRRAVANMMLNELVRQTDVLI